MRRWYWVGRTQTVIEIPVHSILFLNMQILLPLVCSLSGCNEACCYQATMMRIGTFCLPHHHTFLLFPLLLLSTRKPNKAVVTILL
ncbi:hypothetical protein I3760_07G062200 [Carya illinoinensis]|nr:hypothetical protein I3760_07G062200 [Carya illinoinensis]